MITQDTRKQRLLMTGAALVVAAGLGFGVAKLTTHPEPAKPAENEAAPAGPQVIEVPAAHLAVMGIATETLQAGAIGGEILAPATVVSAPTAEAAVVARSAGAIVRLNRRLGDAVRAGETLALIDSRDAAAAASDRSVANARLALARQVAARERTLFEQRVSPRQDMETAQAELAAAEAEARRAAAAASAVHVAGDGRSAAIVSPISGRITVQSAALGAYVEPQTELFRVADPRFVQVEAQVSPADAARLVPGDRALLVRQDGSTVNATVRSVAPTASGESRTATVVLSPVDGAGLTAGVAVQARLSAKPAGAVGGVVAPDEAVQSVDGRDVVFVRNDKGFVAQPVAVASRSGGLVSITSGVRPGQTIATRNAFLLKAELQKGGEE